MLQESLSDIVREQQGVIEKLREECEVLRANQEELLKRISDVHAYIVAEQQTMPPKVSEGWSTKRVIRKAFSRLRRIVVFRV